VTDAKWCRHVTRGERRASLEKDNATGRPRLPYRGRLRRSGRIERSGVVRTKSLCRGIGDSMYTRKAYATRGSPKARSGMTNRTPARDRPTPHGVAERFVVPLKPGNAGGGKGPQFKTDARRGDGPGDWATYQLRRVFRKLQKALHVKAKARSRLSLLRPVRQDQPRRHPGSCLCRVPLNKGAPGVDGQDFADIDAYLRPAAGSGSPVGF